jgi:hypothetical protein
VKALTNIKIPLEIVVQIAPVYHELAFVVAPENARARSWLVGFLCQRAYDCHSLPLILSVLETRFAEDNKIGLLDDLIGLFRAARDARFYACVCEWFMPCLSERLLELASVETTLKVLRLWVVLTESDDYRIAFPEFSSQGILLFKSAATLINRVFVSFSELSEDIQMKLIKRIARLSRNVLKNNYVPFGIFELYRDSSLRNVVWQTLSMISMIGIESIAQHPPRAIAVWECAKAIARYHLKECEVQNCSVIVEAITVGMRWDEGPLVRESFEILRGVVEYALAHHEVGLAEHYAEQLLQSALVLSQWLMNQSPSQLMPYAPILRMLMALNRDIFGCLKRAALRHTTPETEGHACAVFDDFELQLHSLIVTPNDLTFARHLQDIHAILSAVQTRVVFFE